MSSAFPFPLLQWWVDLLDAPALHEYFLRFCRGSGVWVVSSRLEKRRLVPSLKQHMFFVPQPTVLPSGTHCRPLRYSGRFSFQAFPHKHAAVPATRTAVISDASSSFFPSLIEDLPSPLEPPGDHVFLLFVRVPFHISFPLLLFLFPDGARPFSFLNVSCCKFFLPISPSLPGRRPQLRLRSVPPILFLTSLHFLRGPVVCLVPPYPRQWLPFFSVRRSRPFSLLKGLFFAQDPVRGNVPPFHSSFLPPPGALKPGLL